MAQTSGSGTATGKTGPGLTLTSQSLPVITAVNINIAKSVIEVFYGNNQHIELDLTQTTTLTDSISGTVHTFTIS